MHVHDVTQLLETGNQLTILLKKGMNFCSSPFFYNNILAATAVIAVSDFKIKFEFNPIIFS